MAIFLYQTRLSVFLTKYTLLKLFQIHQKFEKHFGIAFQDFIAGLLKQFVQNLTILDKLCYKFYHFGLIGIQCREHRVVHYTRKNVEWQRCGFRTLKSEGVQFMTLLQWTEMKSNTGNTECINIGQSHWFLYCITKCSLDCRQTVFLHISSLFKVWTWMITKPPITYHFCFIPISLTSQSRATFAEDQFEQRNSAENWWEFVDRFSKSY